MGELQQWVAEECRNGIDTDEQGQTQTDRDSRTPTDTNVKRSFLQVNESVNVSDGPCESLSSSCMVANAALSLLNLACYFLDRQIERLAADFENEGGFTERLYRVRSTKRRNR